MRALEANIKGGHVPQTTDHLKLTLNALHPLSRSPADRRSKCPISPREQATAVKPYSATSKDRPRYGVQTRTNAHELPECALRRVATSNDRLPGHDRVLGRTAASHDEHLQQTE